MAPRRRGPRFSGEGLILGALEEYEKRSREQRWLEREVETNDAVTAGDETVGGWAVRWTFAVQGGQLVVRSLFLEPESQETPPGGITSEVIRGLSPFRAIAAAAPDYFARLEDRTEVFSLVTRWRTEEVQSSTGTATSKRKGGRPRLPDKLLHDVAIAYVEEVSSPSRQEGLLARLGQRFDRPPETVRDWVRIARREGFLPQTKRGAKTTTLGPRFSEGGEQ